MAAENAPVVEARFRAMGSDCHLIVVDGPEDALDRARSRIRDLEARWSRFVPTSEVSALNAIPGTPLVVSPDTRLLVERALAAQRLTAGRFDATVLGDVIRAGYDRPFEHLPQQPEGISDLLRGPVTVIGPTVALAPGVGFDPGGVGKGLAADIVAAEAMAAGVGGICVNLGGDVRVEGAAPQPGGWSIAVEHPGLEEPLATVGLAAGAVATSTRLLRKWVTGGEARHHIIDPDTGRPARTDLTLVTVVATAAWLAETHAKAGLIAGSEAWEEPLAGSGMEGLAVTAPGDVLATPGFRRYTVKVPERLVAAVPEGAVK